MDKFKLNFNFKRLISLALASLLLASCALGTGSSFSSSEIKSFKGTIIPELSKNPILIEKISMDLIEVERKRIPLNLPLALLNYSPESYKVGSGDVLFIYVYGETERLSAALAKGAAINPIFEKIVRDDGTIFYPNAGILEVAGKTVEEIRLTLTDKLSNVLNNPQVDVSVADFKSQKIVLSGNFAKNGTVPVTSVPMTLSEVVANANPFGELGNRSLGDLTSIETSFSFKKLVRCFLSVFSLFTG